MPEPAALAWLAENEADSIERLKAWLRIPSVSTDPAFRSQTRAAAEWAAEHLKISGFTVDILPTRDPATGAEGHPVVLAERPAPLITAGPTSCSTVTTTFSRPTRSICGSRAPSNPSSNRPSPAVPASGWWRGARSTTRGR
jgi:hypothetical protein